MITKQHRDLVDARLQADIIKINAHFKTNFTAPRVLYDIRGGSCAGRITSRDNWSIIHLNPQLFIDNADAQINETAPHELAHWVEWKVYGEWETRGSKRSVHGHRWKTIMSVLGVAADRVASNMDMSSVVRKQKRKFEYSCGCQSHTLSSVRHNRILRGASYTCRSCRQKLVLTKALPKATPPAAPASPRRPKASHKRPTTGSKKQRAQELYDTYGSSHKRASIIKMFIDDLDMSLAGANTYWYNLNK